MSFLSFGRKKKITNEEREEKRKEEMLALIDKQIAKIKKDGKYHGDSEDDPTAHVSLNWGSDDDRYPAKHAVLEALKVYINSRKTNQDLETLKGVLTNNQYYDVAKVGSGFSPEEDLGMVNDPKSAPRSNTGKLVLKVLSEFPSEKASKALIKDQIARIKKDGKYDETRKKMLKTDVHYKAKLNVLMALQKFMESGKTESDKDALEGVLSDPNNNSYNKKRGLTSGSLLGSGSTTNDLVLYVKDNFYPLPSKEIEQKQKHQ